MSEAPTELWVDMDEGCLDRGGPLSAWPAPYRDAVKYIRCGPELEALILAIDTQDPEAIGIACAKLCIARGGLHRDSAADALRARSLKGDVG